MKLNVQKSTIAVGIFRMPRKSVKSFTGPLGRRKPDTKSNRILCKHDWSRRHICESGTCENSIGRRTCSKRGANTQSVPKINGANTPDQSKRTSHTEVQLFRNKAPNIRVNKNLNKNNHG